MNAPGNKAYAEAGVDIDAAERLLDQAKPELKKATRPEALGAIGGFGGLFDISRVKAKRPVLVSSTDGVGTKLKVAFMTGRHENIGADIVNHCCNDIAVCGAEPLYFLDYMGMGKLSPEVYPVVLKSLAKACRKANVALLGGETAEMPGFYAAGEYDLVGTIVGVVDKKKILTGEKVKPGDVILGLASNGLHTNGYSLARKVFFEQLGMAPKEPLPGTQRELGYHLLRPHVNYAPALLELLGKFNKGTSAAARKDNAILAAAHITGGGFTGNIPRTLPEGCGAAIDTRAWKRPPVFDFLAEKSGVSFEELHEVFNMGIGLTLTVKKDSAEAVLKAAKKLGHKAWAIGEVTKGAREVFLEGAPA